jgi:hypothetical protein
MSSSCPTRDVQSNLSGLAAGVAWYWFSFSYVYYGSPALLVEQEVRRP